MKKHTMPISTPLEFPYFRASVGGVIIGPKGKILSFERADSKGSWQSVQGGIDPGETPVQALFREIREEIGLSSKQVTIIAEYPHWLAYEFPPSQMHHKKCAGQAQRWFLLTLTGSTTDIKLHGNGHKTEFQGWKMTTLRRHAEEVVGFKREVYLEFSKYFRKYAR